MSFASSREMQGLRINLHRTRRALLRSRHLLGRTSSSFSSSSRRRNTRTRVGRFDDGDREGKSVLPLIRCAKVFSGLEVGVDSFHGCENEGRSVYAKFSAAATGFFQFAIYYTLTRPIHIGYCPESQSHF